MKFKKFVSIGLTASLIASMTGLSLNAQDLKSSIKFVGVNPDIRYQQMEGWGTSLCWWANMIGGWEEDYNGNGVPEREEIAELIFSPEYLNMNVVRYNVGGGENPDHDHMKRIEAIMPTWKEKDATQIDPTGDKNQIWMLEKANEYRKEQGDIINEVFSNSPPWYMTKSQCATGNTNASENNLMDDKYDEFAQYLADVTEWLDKDLKEKGYKGIEFIDPINEPDTSYWGAGSSKQEGCHFSSGESQDKIFKAMMTALKSKNLTDIKLTGSDETSVDDSIHSFKALSTESKKLMDTISTHTYGSNNRDILRDLAKSYDKGLWMSEVCMGDGPHDGKSLSAALNISKAIQQDLTVMQPTTWVWWVVSDSELESLLHNENWGLIHSVYEDAPVPDYHTNINAEEWTGRKGEYHITKQFYSLMQYSKYIKSGYTIIESGNDDMVAAISPDNKELVIVATNQSELSSQAILDLNKFPRANEIDIVRTSDTENAQQVATESTISEGIFEAQLAPKSITTYVVRNSSGEALFDYTGHSNIVNSSVIADENTLAVGANDINKFQYTGTWAKQSANGSYSNDVYKSSVVGDSATFKFDGNRAVILGTKSADGGKLSISVNGGAAIEVDTNSDSGTVNQAVLFDTGELEKGQHTVNITVTEGTASLDAAKVITGQLGEESFSFKSIKSFNEVAVLEFNTISADTYKVYYGTSESDLTQQATVSGSPAVIRDLQNGTQYYFKLEATKSDGSTVSTGIVSTTPKLPNDKDIYYYVNAAISDIDNPKDDVVLGLYSSNLEQPYGLDIASGKTWGYNNSTKSSTSNGGSDKWQSVRADEQDTAGKGLNYKFELPQGQYHVVIGLYDPWDNGGRKQDIVIQGKKVEENFVPHKTQTEKNYVATVGEDNLLNINILRSAGVNGGGEDPLVSFIIVQKYNADIPVEVVSEQEVVATTVGKVPDLPKEAQVKNLAGDTLTKAIVWNSEATDANKYNTQYQTVTVNGVIEGTNLSVSAKVEVVPENLVYFIDSGSENSSIYQAVKSIANLSNNSADKIYENGSWGYVNDGANIYKTDSKDKYIAGLYAGSNKDLVYKLPLKAGTYEITAGFHEWWGVTRNMKTSVEYTDAQAQLITQPISDKIQVNGSNPNTTSVGTVTLPVDTELTYRVSKYDNNDPVLSWIAVKEIPSSDETLQDAINKSNTILEKENATVGELLQAISDLSKAIIANNKK